MKLIRLTTLLLCGSIGLSATAGADKKPITSHEAGGNYYCYPYIDEEPPAQTPVPAGYTPFHLEHYGRHGSRWHIGEWHYKQPVEILEKAERNGKLTPLGQRTLDMARTTLKASNGRDGELSDNGARQHKAIGRRMARNYPEIFNDSTSIDARSTVVIRSILSMFYALSGIQSIVPGAKVNTDASYADMWYMNKEIPEVWARKQHADTTLLRDFEARHKNNGEYLSRLINDPQFAKDSIGDVLFNPLYSLLVNAQSHSDQPWLVDEIFSPEEIRERWAARNANWFLYAGNSELTGGDMFYSQDNLLNEIIKSVDKAINEDNPNVKLRFGHDTIVLPLAVLLELDNFGEEINDLEELDAKGWHDYAIIPMAGNIQMVFYRKPGSHNPGDVIFKVLLNEREAVLPFKAVSGPYYKWTDAKAYYSKKIADHAAEVSKSKPL